MKDIIQLVIVVVGLTLFFGRIEASNNLNTATLSALKEIQAAQGSSIKILELRQAERLGYEKAKRELERNEQH